MSKKIISSNTEITNVLTSQDESVNRLMSTYKTADSYDFEKFATTTTQVEKNEFLTAMFNKILTQRVFEPMGEWNNPYAKLFTRDKSALGGSEEWLSVDLVEAEDYDKTGTDLLTVKEPVLNIQQIYETDCKKYSISIAPSIMKRAFTTEYGLADLLSQVQSRLQKSKDKYIYNVVNNKLATITKTYKLTSPITALNDTENARKCYEEIIKLVTELAIPNTLYNVNGKDCVTNRGDAILVLNTQYNSSFDVNVLASLFNTAGITLNKYFKDVVVVAQPTDTNCIGYILDKDAIILTNDKLEVTSFYNASNLTTKFYLHNWTKINVNNSVNAIKLMTA